LPERQDRARETSSSPPPVFLLWLAGAKPVKSLFIRGMNACRIKSLFLQLKKATVFLLFCVQISYNNV